VAGDDYGSSGVDINAQKNLNLKDQETEISLKEVRLFPLVSSFR
jgi:hypothetical protein